VNREDIDRMIRPGDDVVLSTTAKEARPGSFFARELKYLAGEGYTVSPDGLRLLPIGAKRKELDDAFSLPNWPSSARRFESAAKKRGEPFLRRLRQLAKPS
jgi:hypothetical protein